MKKTDNLSLSKTDHLSLSKKRSRKETNTHQEEETKQIILTDLPIDVLKLPTGAEYPLSTNKDIMPINHTQKSFSEQVISPSLEKYFYDRRRQIHNGEDPYDIRHMKKLRCFHCLEMKTLPSRSFYKKVKHIPGNCTSVISCCSEKCNDVLNTMISLTDVEKLKNKKIKIPSLGELYKDVEFYLASVIPQSDGEKLSYYFQGSLVNYQEISVWASFDQIEF
jgi:hypothetical protein